MFVLCQCQSRTLDFMFGIQFHVIYRQFVGSQETVDFRLSSSDSGNLISRQEDNQIVLIISSRD